MYLTQALTAIGGSVYALYTWNARLYGALYPAVAMGIVIPFVPALALGVRVIFSSFFANSKMKRINLKS